MYRCNIESCGNTIHSLIYRIQSNNTKHLVGICPIHGYRYLPFVSGLKISASKEKLKTTKNTRLQEAML